MIIATTETIPGKNIVEVLGVARGSTVRARNVGRDIFAGLKNIIGGEISEYTKLQADSREQAMQRMIDDAKRMGGRCHCVFSSQYFSNYTRCSRNFGLWYCSKIWLIR